ncbi:hypothetical protein AHAS_Ahas17G0111800 [Arachis hypogaea]|uniref:Disease resistance protein Roq1-like winged-helix domain-containing protein n=1 Tax=Arachis hypogaea TaxID=3818 RepID=A0A444YC46_ARAHY|nr:hypothetical protein Ahy_B07g087433 [Arachis hypogaea]
MTYEIQGLNEKESLNLLNWKAFKTNIVNSRYTNILTRAVTYAFGLPLALEISFDVLGKEEQNVFLDIAYCFKGYTLMKVTNILQVYYRRCIKYHIGVLVENSLIKINWCDNRVTMHDFYKGHEQRNCSRKVTRNT